MKITPKHWLIIILILAAFLRFYNFTQSNVITDEVLIGIRSIGLIDFDASPVQTSPWQWVEQVPDWMHLSMHDHPILVFLIQHFFFLIFGINLWGLRLVFILTGILSIYLIYLIGKKLFNQKIGLLAAFILSICSYHVWISRIGLQESIVILFILLTFYYFLKSLENQKNLLITFSLLGLCILAKYTSLILIPVFLIIIIQQKRFKEFITSKYFWLGILVFLLIISPSIIYNIKMQQTFGHLDFQLSSAFKQPVSEWGVRFGREQIGSMEEKILKLPLKLKQGLSWPLLIIFILSYFILIWNWLKTKKSSLFILVVLILGWLFWYLIIGSTQRFMTYIIPWLCLAMGWVIFTVFQKIQDKILKRILYLFIIILIIFEIFFTTNTLHTWRPVGLENILWSKLHYEIKDWGFNHLDKYLDNLLKNKMPLASLPPRYNFLSNIKDDALKQMKQNKNEALSILIIYDSNIYDLASLWLFHRRSIYQAWPIISARTFLDVLETESADFYYQSGITDFYFISPTPATLLENTVPLTNWGNKLEKNLIEKNIQPEEIKNQAGEIIFKIYKF